MANPSTRYHICQKTRNEYLTTLQDSPQMSSMIDEHEASSPPHNNNIVLTSVIQNYHKARHELLRACDGVVIRDENTIKSIDDDLSRRFQSLYGPGRGQWLNPNMDVHVATSSANSTTGVNCSLPQQHESYQNYALVCPEANVFNVQTGMVSGQQQQPKSYDPASNNYSLCTEQQPPIQQSVDSTSYLHALPPTPIHQLPLAVNAMAESSSWSPVRPDLQSNHQYQSEMNVYSYPFYPPTGYFCHFSLNNRDQPMGMNGANDNILQGLKNHQVNTLVEPPEIWMQQVDTGVSSLHMYDPGTNIHHQIPSVIPLHHPRNMPAQHYHINNPLTYRNNFGDDTAASNGLQDNYQHCIPVQEPENLYRQRVERQQHRFQQPDEYVGSGAGSLRNQSNASSTAAIPMILRSPSHQVVMGSNNITNMSGYNSSIHQPLQRKHSVQSHHNINTTSGPSNTDTRTGCVRRDGLVNGADGSSKLIDEKVAPTPNSNSRNNINYNNKLASIVVPLLNSTKGNNAKGSPSGTSSTNDNTESAEESSSNTTSTEVEVEIAGLRARTLKNSPRRALTSTDTRESIVIYWMTRELRTVHNHSLAFAQSTADKWNVPLLVYVTPLNSPYSNMRQQDWRIRGMVNVRQSLQKANISMICECKPGWELLGEVFKHFDVISVVSDHFPLNAMTSYRNEIMTMMPSTTSLEEVDAHNVVPSWIASTEAEARAYSFRQNLRNKMPTFALNNLPAPLRHQSKSLRKSFIDLDLFSGKFKGSLMETDKDILSLLDLDIVKFPEVSVIDWALPGQEEGQKLIDDWCDHRLHGYSKYRNNPHLNTSCNFSIYFNHGFISAQYCLLRLEQSNARRLDIDAFANDFLTWKELSDNFTFYNEDYDQYSSFPAWARASLEEHESNEREYIYALAEFESHQTHDRLWNACMKEYIMFGKMHSSLRLYWEKMILEWSENATKALKIAIFLTDKWGLDGSDPISYSDCAWSIGGALDRAFPVRSIYGKVRCITIRGIARKLDIVKWSQKVERSWEAFQSTDPEIRESYKALHQSDEGTTNNTSLSQNCGL